MPESQVSSSEVLGRLVLSQVEFILVCLSVNILPGGKSMGAEIVAGCMIGVSLFVVVLMGVAVWWHLRKTKWSHTFAVKHEFAFLEIAGKNEPVH